MRVLFLGPQDSPLVPYLAERDEVDQTDQPLDRLHGPDWIVSHGYRHILSREIVRQLRGRAVNLHVSLLPWNRGADPNLWSFVDNTPKGVSIHYIDEGVDTGPLIAQRYVTPFAHDTLRSSYMRLQSNVEDLFRMLWPAIRAGRRRGYRQVDGGSYHRRADRERVQHLLTDGWDTPVANLSGARELL